MRAPVVGEGEGPGVSPGAFGVCGAGDAPWSAGEQQGGDGGEHQHDGELGEAREVFHAPTATSRANIPAGSARTQ